VLRAAIVLVDQGGIESLTMRKLGQALGVEAMSLYNHVANKDDILGGIVDLVAGEIDLPAAGADWKAAMRQCALSAHAALARHPWAPSLWMSRGIGRARLRYGNWILGCLREAGFSKDLTYHAFHILEGHILGFTLQQLSFPYDEQELADLATSFLRELPAGEYPYLAEYIAQHLEPRHDDTRAFALGLDLILDGLDRLRDPS
jgi:AcrR family transcriptional regulator